MPNNRFMRRARRWWLLWPLWVFRARAGLLVPLLPLSLLILLSVAVGRVWPAPPSGLVAGDCPQPCWQGLRPGMMTQDEALAVIKQRDLALAGSVRDTTPGSFRVTSSLEWQSGDPPHYNVQMRFNDGRLIYLSLFPEEPMTLADVFSAFGPPTHARLCRTNGYIPVNVYGLLTPSAGDAAGQAVMPAIPQSVLFATLYFFEGAVEVQAVRLLEDPVVQSPGYQLLTPPRQQPVDWLVSPEMRIVNIIYRADVGLASTRPVAARWRGFGSTGELAFCQ